MAASISYQTLSEYAGGGPGLAEYTRTNLAIGSPAANRTVFIASMATMDGDTQVLDTVTVAGVPATLVHSVRSNPAGDNFTALVTLHRVDLASGTTATVVATYSSNIFDYSVYIAAGYDVGDTLDTANGVAISPSLDVNTEAGGVVIAFSAMYDAGLSGPSMTWSGVIERDDTVPAGYDFANSSFADLEVASPSTPLEIDLTHTAASGNPSAVYASMAVSFSDGGSSGGTPVAVLREHYRRLKAV